MLAAVSFKCKTSYWIYVKLERNWGYGYGTSLARPLSDVLNLGQDARFLELFPSIAKQVRYCVSSLTWILESYNW